MPKIKYPEPKTDLHNGKPPVMWQRARVVVNCADMEQAERIAKQVQEFASCEVEPIFAVTSEDGELLGEIAVDREAFTLADKVPLEDGAAE